MTIIFREKKGSPLTSAEVDGNFRELAGRIEQLEGINLPQETLFTIQQEADELIFMGSMGSELGRVRLPTLQINACGPWKSKTKYTINDMVTHSGSVYLCTFSHSGTDFQADQKYWQKLFEVPVSLQSEEKTQLPLLMKGQSNPVAFGTLALYADGNTLELLVGDIDCWRRVRDQQPVKF